MLDSFLKLSEPVSLLANLNLAVSELPFVEGHVCEAIFQGYSLETVLGLPEFELFSLGQLPDSFLKHQPLFLLLIIP